MLQAVIGEEEIRTSSQKKARVERARSQGGVGGAQDGDGLGSSVREHLGSGVPTVEGEGRILAPEEELSIAQYEAKLRQLMAMLAFHSTPEPPADPSTTKQTPKFSDLIDNFLNTDTSNDKLVRDKVRVYKINDIIEELEENPSGELRRGIVELLERKQAVATPNSKEEDYVVTEGSNGWKASSRDTIDGLVRASNEPASKPSTRVRKAKASDEL
jgi:hypothetical protein